MKNLVVLSAEELKNAALSILMQKGQFYGKHVSTIEFVFDKSDPVPSRQIRIECTLFDTEGGARRYLESGTEQEDEPVSAPAAVPLDENAATNLEGESRVEKPGNN